MKNRGKILIAAFALSGLIASGAAVALAPSGASAESRTLVAASSKTSAKKTSTTKKAAAAAARSLTSADFSSGVKDALYQAVRNAVAGLGKENGYFLNPEVKIPVPASLKPATDILGRFGQAALVDNFVQSMNRAAEKAVPETADIFAKAVSEMTLDQAANLVKGPEDAATRYFEEKTRDKLFTAVKPLVGQAMDEARVTSYYSAMMGKAQAFYPFLKQVTPDLNQYVTDKALDGLFLVMAQEEKKIRQDPVARSTEILKKVFGSIFK